MKATYQGETIAESDETVFLDGAHYFPPAAIRDGHLQRTRMKSLCPWKGVASYYTVSAGASSSRNAAWTYRHPSPLARRIKNHVAFGGSVEVRDT